MSGAPVFNESGHVCGIVCSSLAPESEAQEHASYISSLWPLLAIPINAPWQRYAAGESFPLYEYAQAGVIDTIGLEHVTRERTVGGDKISCRYDMSNYRAPPSVDA